ncbi:accessory Sec system glycosylation chaperone GtfB [Macrococcus epidermidis]|uniref:accessory Sec system glycosylation chaperone GtfB n=1 Tax=Macrococcus epidermidis TaxID=1902580 RepID=UPI001EF2D365|nr:accessory Sec system glycosylation chaperone GtfB [Macrococcus epidermidis]MCG7421132.1 accessory Sec system glycosylation chaperone GtfB [Macrococcus epidermidis]
MIILAEQFDSRTKLLFDTLSQSTEPIKRIILEDNGFLPNDIMTYYQFFSNYQSTDKGRFFNALTLPPFYEIEGDATGAIIKDLWQQRANIVYSKSRVGRIIEKVEWLDEEKEIIKVDNYNKHGFKFSEVVFNNQKKVIQRYFNAAQQVIITRYFTNNTVELLWGEHKYFFDTYHQFIKFYLNALELSGEQFIINSLGAPLIILNQFSKKNNHIIVWQENIKQELPANMKIALKLGYTILIPEHNEFAKIKQIINHSAINEFGYHYKLRRQNQLSNHAFNLTNSDQLPNIESIVQKNSNIQFHIAALTEMSQKLLNLMQYSNVSLYPNVSRNTIKMLLETCDIYLDINKGNEVMGINEAAFTADLLILSYEGLQHNLRFTNDSNVFSMDDCKEINHRLYQLYSNKEAFKNLLKEQKAAANHATAEYINGVLNDLKD